MMRLHKDLTKKRRWIRFAIMDAPENENPRIAAAKAGQRRFIGNPCAKCGSPERYTTSGACVKCAAEAATERRKMIQKLIADGS